MLNEAENILLSLKKCVNDDVDTASESKQYICSLKKYFESELTKSELDLSFAAVFDEKNGIISFLTKKIILTKYKSANVEAFNLLQYLVQHYKTRLEHHVLSIKHVCVTCVSLDRPSADEKERAFAVLHEVIKADGWHEDLGLTELMQLLLRQCSARQRPPVKVLNSEYHLLGRIARKYIKIGVVFSEKLLRQLMYELEEQTCKAAKVEFLLIAGCINGLSEFLHSFAQSQDDANNYCGRIYAVLKKLADVGNLHRKVANRAAMSLLAKHGSQFAPQLFKDYLWWHNTLLKWIGMPKEEKTVGYLALETLYQQMAITLEARPEEKQAFMYFMEYFKSRLLSASTHPHELRVVIKAFGQFAGPCQVHMTRRDVLYMFTLIVQRIEQLHIQSEEEDEEESGTQAADYMESLSSIMTRLPTIGPDQLAALERIAVSVVQRYPRLVWRLQPRAVRALTVTLHHMARCSEVHLDHFVRNVVYQGIVRTCSHPIMMDVELLKDAAKPDSFTTYKNYIPLWRQLLSVEQYKHLKVSPAMERSLVTKVYDEIISAVLVLIKKLDLNTRQKTAGDSAAGEPPGPPALDPETGLEATTPQDFLVFINLVDLCRDLLPTAECHLFARWLHAYARQVVYESYRKPLVSGFYKLLAAALRIADTIGYFADENHKESEACSKLVCKFLQEVVVRQTEYKADLQVACLELVLAAPVELVVPLVPYMAPAFQVIFRVGSSYLPLAHTGLDALERWNSAIPSDKLQKLLTEILPYLDPFLKSKGYEGDPKLVAEGGRSPHPGQLPQGQLQRLQRRIVCFLGTLNTGVVLSLVTARQRVATQHAVRCQTHLDYRLPFADMRPVVHLDELLPRVIELALRSSDRRTRVAACELLHACVMYLLGHSALLESGNPELLASLFEQLAMPLLQLGCDTDQVVHQLFNPLMMQLTHWYSSQYQLRSKQAGLLLQTLMEGISYETDTAIRDFSARCLREFVVWSIKQLSPQELKDSPVNITVIVKNIYAFCVHPSVTKRLGAALAFNSVYSVLREEEAILDRFWLELMYYMVVNLAAVDDSPTRGHQEQVAAALDHLERGLRVKAALFNKPSRHRRQPPEMGGSVLRDAVSWLLNHCSSVQAECRHKCMKLVCSLAPCIEDCSSAAQFVGSFPLAAVLCVCEGGATAQGIVNMTAPAAEQPLGQHLAWLGMLLASLDCYVWLLGESLVEPDSFFAQPEIRPEIFSALVSLLGLQDVAAKHDIGAGCSSSPWELEKFNTVKCSVIVRTFDFVCEFLRRSRTADLFRLADPGFPQLLFELLAGCVFRPDRLGFDMQSAEVVNNLPLKLEETLCALKRDVKSSEHLAWLNRALAQERDQTQGGVFADLKKALKQDAVSAEQIHFVNGMKILQRCKMLSEVVSASEIIDALFSSLTSQVGGTDVTETLQPNARAHAYRLLELSFSLGEQVSKLVECILSSTQLKSVESHSSVTHGQHFLTLMRPPVMNHLLSHPQQTAESLLGLGEFRRSVPILIDVLQQLSCERNKYPKASVLFEACIFRHWPPLEAWATSDADHDSSRQLLDLLSNLASVVPSCVGFLCTRDQVASWVLQQIRGPAGDVRHKCKALELLPCLTGPDQEDNEPLKNALKALRDQHFPQCSGELAAESSELTGFVNTFQNLLLGLQLSGSRVLLRSLVAMAAGDSGHVCEPAIQATLAKFIARLGIDNQGKSVQLAYDIFTSSDGYDSEVRLGCVRRFVATMLHACDAAAVKCFYAANVGSLVEILGTKLDRRHAYALEQQLAGRVGAWLLVEIMFAKLDKDYLEDVSCPITLAAFPGKVATGKELIADLTRRAMSVRSEDVPGEMARASQCAAYNALTAIICNTKREAKFYAGLLFAEQRVKNQPLWERLVDCARPLHFPIDVDEIPTRRKQLVSIRRQAGEWEEGEQVEYIPSSSQLLFSSTLNEDVTRFDFSNCIVRSFNAQQPSGEVVRVRGPCNMSVYLLEDELNAHECMATLCAVIQHVVDTNVTPVQEHGMPVWMEYLKSSFLDGGNPRNVRVFIVKLLLNVRQYFQPYAKLWVAPLLSAVADGSLGDGINYLIADVISVAASWGTVAIDRHLATTVLAFLMAGADNLRRDIFRYNLELVKSFVEIWKPYLDVPHVFLLERVLPCVVADNHSRGCEVGIQLAGIVLANGLAPWSDATKPAFLRHLLTNLDHPKRDIYRPCSEIVGWCLKIMDRDLTGQLSISDNDFSVALHKKLQSLSLTDKGKFLTCLSGIHKAYVCVVDSYVTYITHLLPKMYGTFKTACLEMLLARLELLRGSAYKELKAKGLFEWLNHQDARNQELALRLIKKMVDTMEPEELQEALVEVCRFSGRNNIACRSLMYELLMWVRDQRSDQVRWGAADNRSKATLLRGVVDPDAGLQDMVYK